MTKTALVIVDVQYDFIDGSLPVHGGEEVAQKIALLIAEDAGMYDVIYTTQDWHDLDSHNGDHFSDTPDYVDTWPAHCVENTRGAEIHEDVLHALSSGLPEDTLIRSVKKGQGEPAYSGFQGTTEGGHSLLEDLRDLGVTHVDVVGLAADYCVKATALDAITNGFDTIILREFTAGINTSAGEVAEEMDLLNSMLRWIS